MNSKILFLTILQFILLQAISAEHINRALGKPVYINQKHDASNGLDGNPDTYAMCDKSWFVVDLGELYNVRSIEVKTRTNCCGRYLNYFKVGLMTWFDPKNLQKNDICGIYGTVTDNNKAYKITCKVTRFKYRYVLLWTARESENLIFSYLKVFKLGDESTDIAMNKNAHCIMSLPEWSAVNGVDGNISTVAKSNEENYWFVVDLQNSYRVHYVKLFTHSSGDSMSDFKVGLMNEFNRDDFQRNTNCGEFQGITIMNQNYRLECKHPFPLSRYVSLFVPEGSPKDMTFSELEVYSDKRIFYMNEYMGCVKKKVKSKKFVEVTTVDQCIYICSTKSFQYAYITNDNECECVNKLNGFESSSKCHKCSDEVHTCGSKEYSSVYAVEECGSNGTSSCMQKCAETKVDGKCPSGCLEEDNSCAKRDCTINNGQCGNHTCITHQLTLKTEITECVCKPGFHKRYGFNDICNDINECGLKSVCDGECVNMNGTFQCYEKKKDGEIEESNSNTAVIGGIIGFIVVLFIIVAVVYYVKKNKESNYSDRLQKNSAPA